MVFSKNGVAKLIDFDLTDKIDVEYPLGYNYHLPECHPNAVETWKRAIVHDRHSAIRTIIQKANPTKEEKSKLPELINSWFNLQTFY